MADKIMFDGDGLTVVDAMAACDMDHITLCQDKMQAQHLATEIFGNQFALCLEVTFKELNKHFQTYSYFLSVA